MPDVKELLVILASYGLGCFTTAYYLIHLRLGDDIRRYGSGNAGARNAGRVLGAWGFGLALLGDVAKGALAMGLAHYFELGPAGLVLAMIAVVVGHIWPVQLRFRGGKGLAAALGAMLVFDLRLMLGLLVVCGLLLLLLRQATPSALVTVALAPAAAWGLSRPWPTVAGIAFLALLILWAHRSNIRATLNNWRKPPTGGTSSVEKG